MDLDDYIALQEQEGYLESTGVVTISPQDLLKKLARFGLDSDASALLRMIMGCVGLKTKELWIETKGSDLCLGGTHDHPNALLETLVAGFNQIENNLVDCPTADLLIGMAHRLGAPECTIGLSRWQDGKLVQWENLFGPVPKKVVRHPSAVSSGFAIHILSAGAPWQLDLEKWAKKVFFCPMPLHFQGGVVGDVTQIPFDNSTVLLDYYRSGIHPVYGTISPRWRCPCGTELAHPVDATQVSPKNQSGTQSYLRYLGNPHDPAPPQWFEPQTGGLRDSLLLPLRMLLSRTGDRVIRPLPYCDGLLYLGLPDTAPSHKVAICPVKRGVMLTPLEVELPCPTAVVVLPCDSLPTDLSGEHIVSCSRDETVQRALQLIKEGLQICCQNRLRLPDPNQGDIRPALAMATSVGITVGVLALTGAWALIWPAVFLAAGFGAIVEIHLNGDQRKNQVFDEISRLSKDLMSSPEERLCPRCRVAMSLQKDGYHCGSCSGDFLEGPLARTLLNKPHWQKSLPSFDDSLLPTPELENPSGVRPPAAQIGPCTRCQTTMLEIRHQSEILGVCPACQAVFVGRGT